MKTQEQIKKEVINYLDKTSLHVFIKPKSTFDWKESKYNYDYKDFTYFKVIKESDNVYKILEDGKIRDLNYEYKKMKSVKTTKLVDEVINVIKKV